MRRGEIYFVDLDPVVGQEQGGRRPVLVVSDPWVLSRPLVVSVVPGTNGARVHRDYPTNVRVPADDTGLTFETVFLCFHVRSLDRSRFRSPPVGSLHAGWMKSVADALKFSLGVK